MGEWKETQFKNRTVLCSEEKFKVKDTEMSIYLTLGAGLSYAYGNEQDIQVIISAHNPERTSSDYFSPMDMCISISNSKREAVDIIKIGVKNVILHNHFTPVVKRTASSMEPVKYSKEAYRYAYPVALRIGRILTSKIFKKLHEINNISEEEVWELVKIGYRLFPGKGARYFHERNKLVADLLSIRKSMNAEHYEVIKSDLKKYRQLHARYIAEGLDKAKNMAMYHELLSSIPKYVKKCKYILPLTRFDEYFSRAQHYPKNRFQWYMACVLDPYLFRTADYGHMRNGQFVGETANYHKFARTDKTLWAYFKKFYPQYKGAHYSLKLLRHMMDTITDGFRMYHQLSGNEYGIHFAKVEGSPMRMLRNAIYNHHQEAKVNVEKIKAQPDRQRRPVPSDFPEWIKDIYMDTRHKMLIAGKECRHCIGSYADHHDYFVREGDVCAQIYSHDLTVGQCYDIKDTVTERSEDLRKRLEEALTEYKEKKYEESRAKV